MPARPTSCRSSARAASGRARAGSRHRRTGSSWRSTAGAGGMVLRFATGRGGRRGPGEPAAFHTDDGAFTLEDVPAGRWDVEVRADGYQSGRTAGVVVDEGASAEGVEVRLSRGGVISGRVLDARSGRPIREASIRADLASGGGPRMRMGPEG